MFHSPLHARLLVVALLLTLVLGALPVSPAVAATDCTAPGPGANLKGCDLSGLDLSGFDLSGASLAGAHLSGTNLAGANLQGASLRDANLEGANLDAADLRGANLSGATIYAGALDNANTAGANLRVIVVEAPVAPQAVSLSWSYFGVGTCYADVSVTGFAPGSYPVHVVDFQIPELPIGQITVGDDGTGSMSSSQTGLSFFEGGSGSAVVNGVSSSSSTASC